MRGARANHNANTIAPATDVSAELLVTWSSDRPCGVLEQSGSPRSRRGYVWTCGMRPGRSERSFRARALARPSAASPWVADGHCFAAASPSVRTRAIL